MVKHFWLIFKAATKSLSNSPTAGAASRHSTIRPGPIRYRHWDRSSAEIKRGDPGTPLYAAFDAAQVDNRGSGGQLRAAFERHRLRDAHRIGGEGGRGGHPALHR